MTIADAHGGPTPGAGSSPVDGRPGWWPSPWSAGQVAAGKVSRGGLQCAGGTVYWVEGRPDQGGRPMVVAADPDGTDGARPVDVSPAGSGVRSRVHEYGGGAALVAGGSLFYVDQDDQAWHRVAPTPGATPVLLATAPGVDGSVRHADGSLTPDGRWLVSVEERVGHPTTTHRLVATPADGGRGATVPADAGDFVASPRVSPDGGWLAWTTWDHPAMPWDASTVRVAPIVAGEGPLALGPTTVVAGGPGTSVGQPRWCRDGSLLFADDRSGWWLLYRVGADTLGGPAPVAFPLVEVEAEFHGPDWVFAQHTFAELADGSVVARMGTGGRDRLVVLRPPSGRPDGPGWSIEEVEQPCVSIAAVDSPDGHSAVVLGSTPTEAQVVLAIDLDGARPPRRLSAPPAVVVAPDQASVSAPRTGRSGAHRIPGLVFPPTNPAVGPGTTGPPPLVVFCHGGPTSGAEPGYDPVVQFLTSRGIAVASVDYRGSSGYGRAYRELLAGRWGEADVDDCVAYAESLAADGLVDGTRMAIRGTSAGGLTALSALIRARTFVGAVAWYGVTDLAALATDTHDFESRYLDGLVGPLPGAAATYRDRSPVHHATDLVGRVLLLQGTEDPVVPPAQAEGFAAELRAGGADCTLVLFEGESHGFRRADTIEAALTAELDFYRALFTPDDTRAL
jgi:dipeptidyl aminopeptidase/acylaminoacyl peptidase